jgi:hypothetical protein
VDYYLNNHSAILISALIATLSIFPALWFIGAQSNRLRRAEGDQGGLATLALASAVGTGVIATVGGVLPAAAAFRIAQQPGSGLVVRAMTDASGAILGGLWVFAAVWAGAASLVILRTGVLPAWLGWLGMLMMVVGLFGTLTALSPNSPLGLITFVVFGVWILASSITVTVRGSSRPAATEATYA